jgi:hypothetical protein
MALAMQFREIGINARASNMTDWWETANWWRNQRPNPGRPERNPANLRRR